MGRRPIFLLLTAATSLLAAACERGTLDGSNVSTTAPSGGDGVGGEGVGVGGGDLGGLGGDVTGGLGGASEPRFLGHEGIELVAFQAQPCPPDMALVGAFCVDRYEAPNQPGASPLVMQSAITAEGWCGERGKRLCTEDEWDFACAGAEEATYPYGDSYQVGACNDGKMWKKVDEDALATWPSEAAKAEVVKLYQADPSGARPECMSGYGVFDMTGNVEEWVVRTKPNVNNYPHVLKGCYWSGCYGGSKPTCASRNPAHDSGFMFYETGFRCCRDAL